MKTLEEIAPVGFGRVRITARGCWELASVKTRYPAFRFHGRKSAIHRVLCTIFIGRIPAGNQALHTCDNERCVRPDHLFIGTQKDNMQDASRKGRLCGNAELRGKRAEIRAEYARGLVSQTELATRYGCRSQTICNIVNGVRRENVNGKSVVVSRDPVAPAPGKRAALLKAIYRKPETQEARG